MTVQTHIVTVANNMSNAMAVKLMEALKQSWWSRHGTVFTLQGPLEGPNGDNVSWQISARRDGVYSDTELADLGGFCSGFVAGVMSLRT